MTTTSDDADDGLFSSAMAAAAAVTNSPSYGPVVVPSSPDLNPHTFGIGGYLSPAAWPGSNATNLQTMPSLSLPPTPTATLRTALSNLKLQNPPPPAASYVLPRHRPYEAPSYVPPATLYHGAPAYVPRHPPRPRGWDGNNKPPPTRSFLVEELRAAIKSTNTRGGRSSFPHIPARPVPFTLSDVRGHAIELAQDQFGSRWLQQQLSSPSVSPEAKQTLFEEILPASKELAYDTFGNYCVQILLNPAVGRPEQQRALCEVAFEGHMLELSRNTYACRCIQSLIKLFQLGDPVIPLARQDKMLRELEGNILQLVTDSNANHVAQQIIERVRPIHRIDFILTKLTGHYVHLAKDPYGCRVCQRVLENAAPARVEQVLDELLDQVDHLITDSMGNYVVQHIIAASGDRFRPQRTRLVEAIKQNLLPYATHKFASNVVEKVLENGDRETRRQLIGLMLEPLPPTNTPMLVPMMSDLFANYVLQRSLAVAEHDQLVLLAQIIRACAPELRRVTHGKHILAALDKALQAAGLAS